MLDNFCNSQMEIVEKLKNEIDNWNNKLIKKEELVIRIKKIVKINEDIIYKDGEIGSIIKQRLGKKRLRLIEKILREEC